MKLLTILGVAVGGGLLILLVILMVKAAQSKEGEAQGLVNGRLAPCSAKPNCVNSEEGTPADKRVAPLVLSPNDSEADWGRLQEMITTLGGELRVVEDHYLAATFTSSLFGFVDDFEARRDDEAGVIRLRSASRVGTSDLGANRTRVEQLRQVWSR